jgi:hypothetical protein
MPDGAQVHPHCEHAATHDGFHAVDGSLETVLPFIVPVDLVPGSTIVFKVTVVRDYETWFAFDSEAFETGSPSGAGTESVGFPVSVGDARREKRPANAGDVAREEPRAPRAETEAHPIVEGDAEGRDGRKLSNRAKAPRTTTTTTATSASATTTTSTADPSKPEDATQGNDHVRAREPVPVGGRKANAGGERVEKKKGTASVSESPSSREKLGKTQDPMAIDVASVKKKKRLNARLAHGFAMAMAWLFFAPTGSLVARHGKASKSWFGAHRFLGALAAATTAVSSWYIVSVRGWSTPWGKHGTTGGFVLVLVALQALGGQYRKRFPRTKWSAWHRNCGFVLLVVAAYNCLAGAALVGWMEVEYKGLLNVVRTVVLVWVAVAVALEVRKRNAGVARKRGRTA